MQIAELLTAAGLAVPADEVITAAMLTADHVIAQHPGLERALRATLAAIESAPELADVLAEKAGQPGLVGRARALSHRAHNDIEAGLAVPDPTGDVVWVSPNDICARRVVQVPRPVAEALNTFSNQVQVKASKAASIAAFTRSIDLTNCCAAMPPKSPARLKHPGEVIAAGLGIHLGDHTPSSVLGGHR